MGSNQRGRGVKILAIPATLIVLATPALALEDAASGMDEARVLLDTLWVMIAGFLVFFMNAGFALVESGFCRSKRNSSSSWCLRRRPPMPGCAWARPTSA